MRGKLRKYAVCVKNTGHHASLEIRKIYALLPDAEAARHHLVRVIDESGEDYLYPEKWFISVNLSPTARRAVSADARKSAA
jgi:hypothetical protein